MGMENEKIKWKIKEPIKHMKHKMRSWKITKSKITQAKFKIKNWKRKYKHLNEK